MFAMLALVFLTLAAIACGVKWHAEIAGLFGEQSAANAQRPDAGGQKQLWTCGMHPQVIQDHPGDCPICHMKLTPLETNPTNSAVPSGERKVKYWWDPMLNPPYISDRPGKSPMGMDLVPVYEDEVSAGAGVTIDPLVVQNMGVRVATVTEGPLARTIRAVGYLEEPEPQHVDVNLRVSGWIQKLFADTDGKSLGKGDPLFELYSPELQIAIEDLIAARKARDVVPAGQAEARGMASTMYASIAKKLELLGVDPADVELFAGMEQAPATVTFKSPLAGHLTEKLVYAGAAVKAGEKVMRIADRSTMWLNLRVFERDLAYVHVGVRVRATVEALPGKTLEGKVLFVHPHLDPMTRTALVRTNLPNPDEELRQGMYATGEIRVQVAPRALLVPREAVIDTGERQIAFVALAGGHFEPRKVKLGAAGEDGFVQVLEGLAPGESVVTSGQFLLDAESRVREAIQKHLDKGLLRTPASAVAPAPKAGSQPTPTAPANEAQRKRIDAVFAAYLALTNVLGGVLSDDAAVDPRPLIDASKALLEQATGTDRQLSDDVLHAATALEGRKLEEQREAMKPLGTAMIALADHAPPAKQVSGKLYVVHCPMAPGDWLQTTAEIANPFYARTMKSCGEVLRTIDTVEGH
ncbi:MAG: efflux RND transporter periplasmic adaptor subunit [Planctomycetota bacterium]